MLYNAIGEQEWMQRCVFSNVVTELYHLDHGSPSNANVTCFYRKCNILISRRLRSTRWHGETHASGISSYWYANMKLSIAMSKCSCFNEFVKERQCSSPSKILYIFERPWITTLGEKNYSFHGSFLSKVKRSRCLRYIR